MYECLSLFYGVLDEYDSKEKRNFNIWYILNRIGKADLGN